MSVYDKLRETYPHCAALITASEARGNATYPLPLTHEKKANWTPDLREELADAMVYTRLQLTVLAPLMRTSSRARHAGLTLRDIERRLARCLADIGDLDEEWADGD